jgi:GTP cyclohydrolase I
VNPTLTAVAAHATPDVQAQSDDRGITIDRVGIRRLRYPLLLATPSGPQATVAEWELTVELDARERGTHMSRFVETLEAFADVAMSGRRLMQMLAVLRDRLDAPRTDARCTLTQFIERAAPISEQRAQHVIDCSFVASSSVEREQLTLGVRVPITTLCPCSKEISEYGAHNQRGYVSISAELEPTSDLGFLDLLAIAERSGSAVVYPLLKRVDERHVTMQAYDSPTFVEDVVRNAALGLIGDPRVIGFTVEAENNESIHDHSAVASVNWRRQ